MPFDPLAPAPIDANIDPIGHLMQSAGMSVPPMYHPGEEPSEPQSGGPGPLAPLVDNILRSSGMSRPREWDEEDRRARSNQMMGDARDFADSEAGQRAQYQGRDDEWTFRSQMPQESAEDYANYRRQHQQVLARNNSQPATWGDRLDQAAQLANAPYGFIRAGQAIAPQATDFLVRQAMPVTGTVVRTGEAIQEGYARRRMEAGTGTQQDALFLAQQERRHQIDEDARRTWGSGSAYRAANFAQFVGEMFLVDKVIPGGRWGASAAWGILSARTAAMTVGTPALWTEAAVRNNNEAGRDPLSLQGVPGPIIQAYITNRIFEGGLHSNSLAGRVTGSGVGSAIGRGAARTAGQMMEQQAADIVTSMAARVVPWVEGLDTKWGTLGHLVEAARGNETWGDAARHFAFETLTFAIFAAVHAPEDSRRAAEMRARGGATDPTAAPGTSPTPGSPSPAGERPVDFDALPREIATAGEALVNERSSRGESRGEAFGAVARIYEAFQKKWHENPHADRTQAAEWFGEPKGEAEKAFLESLVSLVPERGHDHPIGPVQPGHEQPIGPETPPPTAEAPRPQEPPPTGPAGSSLSPEERAALGEHAQRLAARSEPSVTPNEAAVIPNETSSAPSSVSPPAPRPLLRDRMQERGRQALATPEQPMTPLRTQEKASPLRQLWERAHDAEIVKRMEEAAGEPLFDKATEPPVTMKDIAKAANLTPQEARVLEQRLVARRDLADIAREIGVTRERARQIEKSALEKAEAPASAATMLKEQATTRSAAPRELRSEEAQGKKRSRSAEERKQALSDAVGDYLIKAAENPDEAMTSRLSKILTTLERKGHDLDGHLSAKFLDMPKNARHELINLYREKANADEQRAAAGRGGRSAAPLRRGGTEVVRRAHETPALVPPREGARVPETGQGAAVSGGTGRSAASGHELSGYHGTRGEFTDFHPDKTLEGWFHFGSEKSAKDRIGNTGPGGGRVEQYGLDIKNPLRVKDKFSGDPKGVYHELEQHIPLSDRTRKLYADLPFHTDKQYHQARKDLFRSMKDDLVRAGHDGMVYTNETEDPGSTSYVALDSKQISPRLDQHQADITRLDKEITHEVAAQGGPGTGATESPAARAAQAEGHAIGVREEERRAAQAIAAASRPGAEGGVREAAAPAPRPLRTQTGSTGDAAGGRPADAGGAVAGPGAAGPDVGRAGDAGAGGGIAPRGWGEIEPTDFAEQKAWFKPLAREHADLSKISPHHAKIADLVAEMAQSPQHSPGLSETAKKTHTENFLAVVEQLGTGDAARVSSWLKDIRFREDIKALNEFLKTVGGKVGELATRGGQVGGAVGWTGERGALAVDGDQVAKHAQQLVAHELMHIVDGPAMEISKSPAFTEIYNRDFKGGQYGSYAGSNPQEALAKIGEMLFTGTSLKEMEKRFPGLTATLESFGVTGRGDKPYTKPAEVFIAGVTDNGTHADILKGKNGERFDLASIETDKGKSLEETLAESRRLYDAKPTKQKPESLTQSFLDEWHKAGGGMFPAMTRLAREVGEKAARYINAGVYGRGKAAELVEKVLGKGATEEQHVRAQGLFHEMRLDEAEPRLRARAAQETAIAEHNRREMERFAPGTESTKILEERAKAAEKNAEKFTKDADNALKASVVGKEGSPFATRGDYEAFRDSPEGQRLVEFRKKFVTPVSNEIYALGKGLDPEGEHFDSLTQIKDMPVNFKRITDEEAAGERTAGQVRFGTSRGNLRNVLARDPGLTKAASFAAKNGYDIHFGRSMEHLMGQYKDAAKADLINSMVRNHVAVRGTPGAKPAEESKFFGGHKGVEFDIKRSGPEMTLHVDPRAAGEFRTAMDVDKPAGEGVKALKSVGQIFTAASTMGAGEPTAHLRNMATMLFRPRVIRGLIAAIKMGADTRGERLIELAKMGAAKEHGFDAAKFDRMAEASFGSSAINYTQRAVETVTKLPPFSWAGKIIEHADHMMRLGADKAFDSMLKDGAVNTETNRRNFINQVGQYNKAAQARLVVLARDLGVNPFATASANFYVQGIRQLTMAPGVETKTTGSQARLRGEQLMKSAAFVSGAIFAVNYALNGNIFGDDQTPLGAIKVGTLPDGRTRYWDIGGFTGITRGMRETGLMSVGRGLRRGDNAGQIFDAAAHDALTTPAHLLTGPTVHAAYTLATGHNALGHDVAGRVRQDDTGLAASQQARNIGAAAAHANPITGAIHERMTRRETPSAEETAAKLAGALGPRYSPRPTHRPLRRQ